MPINSIENATRYSNELDKMFAQKSATGFFADNALATKFVGAKTVIIPDVDFQGLADYDRDTGFSRGAITVSNASYTMAILNRDAAGGKHFADRYTRFHQFAEALSAMTERDYLHRFRDICNLTADLKKSVVDEDDDYVFLAGTTLLTMDEFLRFAVPGTTYHIGGICKYHQ